MPTLTYTGTIPKHPHHQTRGKTASFPLDITYQELAVLQGNDMSAKARLKTSLIRTQVWSGWQRAGPLRCWTCGNPARSMYNLTMLNSKIKENDHVVDICPIPTCKDRRCDLLASHAVKQTAELAERLSRQNCRGLQNVHYQDIVSVKCDFCDAQSFLKSNAHDETRCTMKACGGCRSRYYCSRECQINDWDRGHSHVCRQI